MKTLRNIFTLHLFLFICELLSSPRFFSPVSALHHSTFCCKYINSLFACFLFSAVRIFYLYIHVLKWIIFHEILFCLEFVAMLIEFVLNFFSFFPLWLSLFVVFFGVRWEKNAKFHAFYAFLYDLCLCSSLEFFKFDDDKWH